jgi:hypothetical protein
MISQCNNLDYQSLARQHVKDILTDLPFIQKCLDDDDVEHFKDHMKTIYTDLLKLQVTPVQSSISVHTTTNLNTTNDCDKKAIKKAKKQKRNDAKEEKIKNGTYVVSTWIQTQLGAKDCYETADKSLKIPGQNMMAVASILYPEVLHLVDNKNIEPATAVKKVCKQERRNLDKIMTSDPEMIKIDALKMLFNNRMKLLGENVARDIWKVSGKTSILVAPFVKLYNDTNNNNTETDDDDEIVQSDDEDVEVEEEDVEVEEEDVEVEEEDVEVEEDEEDEDDKEIPQSDDEEASDDESDDEDGCVRYSEHVKKCAKVNTVTVVGKNGKKIKLNKKK